MTSTQYTASGLDVAWLFEDFLKRCPGAQSVVLASDDGLCLSYAGLTKDLADSSASSVVGVLALSTAWARAVGDETPVSQSVTETAGNWYFVMHAGQVSGSVTGLPSSAGTVIAVQASATADPSMIGHEMSKLVRSLASHLITPVRTGEAAGGVER
ncbi:roadblock/LC7 domain-containing protein [Kitasatospora sp. NPDC094028]